MPIQMTLKAAPEGVSVKLWTDTAQGEALDQLKNVARLPVTYSHVAAMPDVHYGRGATVGSVIATRSAWTLGAACTPCASTSRPASSWTTCARCVMPSRPGPLCQHH